MRSSDRIASFCPSAKFLTSSSDGWATNSVVATRIDQQPGLEIAAGVDDRGVAVDAVEGAADLDIAGHEGDAVGRETR